MIDEDDPRSQGEEGGFEGAPGESGKDPDIGDRGLGSKTGGIGGGTEPEPDDEREGKPENPRKTQPT